MTDCCVCWQLWELVTKNQHRIPLCDFLGHLQVAVTNNQQQVHLFHPNYGQLQQSANDQSKHSEGFGAAPSLQSISNSYNF